MRNHCLSFSFAICHTGPHPWGCHAWDEGVATSSPGRPNRRYRITNWLIVGPDAEWDRVPADLSPISRRCARRGRKAVTIYLDTAAHRQLRMLALEQSRSVQDLMTEATNDLFQKLGKARITD